MYGLPVNQPYTTLFMLGAKTIETRHWRPADTMIGQRVAIYATKGVGEIGEVAYREMCASEPFRSVLAAAGHDASTLPRSAIVGSAVIARCPEMTEESIEKLERVNPQEAAFGFYAPGRFAWVLEDVEPLPVAVPFQWPVKGQAKFIDVPDHLLGPAPVAPPAPAPTLQPEARLW